MAGGTFIKQNKVRPGAYVNVKSTRQTGTADSQFGVVGLPLSINFGPEKEIIKITATSDLSSLGYELADKELLLVKEAFKRAQTVLLYRVSSGNTAQTVEGDLTIKALYSGTRGNDINVVSKLNVDSSDTYEVSTYLGGNLVDVQSVKNIAELQNNQYVEFIGEGELAPFSTTLEGGTDQTATAKDYGEFFDAISLYEFNTVALPVESEEIKIAGVSFAKRMREDEGKKIQVVIANYGGDYEGVINVINGVVLEDGTTINAEQATVWVAAASASAGVAKSLTYEKYDGAVDVTKRFVNTDIINSLTKGEFLFTEKRGEVVVEQDINSLVNYTNDKNSTFSKNRVIRVIDDIANNAKKTFEDFYIGKVNNDVDGRELFKADRIAYFDNLQAAGAIENFSVEDIEVLRGEAKDSVVLNVAVQPVDAMEKLYMTVQVV